jgi:hypothetical protein
VCVRSMCVCVCVLQVGDFIQLVAHSECECVSWCACVCVCLSVDDGMQPVRICIAVLSTHYGGAVLLVSDAVYCADTKTNPTKTCGLFEHMGTPI